jgi:undecaprenyl-diphosphatase
MTIFQSILLGVIQGLTEFLPISSSGHLVIVPYLLGWEFQAQDVFIFNVLVQVATLVAVFAYFWFDLLEIAKAMLFGLFLKSPMGTPSARLGWYLIIGTLPAGIFGIVLKNSVEKAFSSPLATGVSLLFTAVLLVIAERIGKRNKVLERIKWIDAVWIGMFQVLAIFPGVSRSGATITGGMIRDIERPSSARFAFLLSIPIMLAAGLSAVLDLIHLPDSEALLLSYIPGFISAAFVGYLAIRWLIKYLTNHSLYIFAVYCTLLGLAVISFYAFG